MSAQTVTNADILAAFNALGHLQGLANCPRAAQLADTVAAALEVARVAVRGREEAVTTRRMRRAVARPVLPFPGGGCLQCAGLIPSGRLREEALTPDERAAQRYVDDDEVHEPSVITLNSIGASLAINDLLLMVTGLLPDDARIRALMYDAQERVVQTMNSSSELACRYCGTTGRSHFARGDRGRLPCRETQ